MWKDSATKTVNYIGKNKSFRSECSLTPSFPTSKVNKAPIIESDQLFAMLSSATVHDLLCHYITMLKWAARQGRKKWFRDWETDTERIMSKTGIKLQRLSKTCIIYAWYPAWMSSSKLRNIKFCHCIPQDWQVLVQSVKRLSQGYTMPSDTDIQSLSCMPQPHWFALGPTPSVFFLSVCVPCVRQLCTNSKPTHHQGSIQFSRAMKRYIYITWLAINMQKTSSCESADGRKCQLD